MKQSYSVFQKIILPIALAVSLCLLPTCKKQSAGDLETMHTGSTETITTSSQPEDASAAAESSFDLGQQASDQTTTPPAGASSTGAGNTGGDTGGSTGNGASKVSSRAPVKPVESHVEVKPAESIPSKDAPAASAPKEEKPIIIGLSPVKPTEYYGRRTLAKDKNAQALLAAYDRIVAGSAKTEQEINLKDSRHPITSEEARKVVFYYFNDYPQHFWVGNSFGMSVDPDTDEVYTVKLNYIMTGTALKQAKKQWNTALKKMLNGISGSDSDYDREKMLHDRLAAKVVYEETPNAHNAYGALVEGKAVCEGYADAFQYLCYQAGLPCLLAAGSSANPSTGSPEPHAWNIVQIDGAYYHVDVTWNDQDDQLYYAYFNLTDHQIKKDHTIGTDQYELPACTADQANYFVKTGGILKDGYAPEQIGTLLKKGNLTARLYLTSGSADAFWEWVKKEGNMSRIAKVAGVRGGYSIYYSALGQEVILQIKPV